VSFWETLAIGSAAGVLGGVTGALTTLLQARKSLEAQYDIDLRKSRIDTYRQLWSSLQPLAYYGGGPALHKAGLRDLSRAMQSWYYGRGGLFMSEQTRTAYFDLHALLEEGARTAAGDGRIDPRVVKAFRGQASKLRTAMASDVATRRPPRIRDRSRLWRRLRERRQRGWERRQRGWKSVVEDRAQWAKDEIAEALDAKSD
jgi:hypothetical protein